MNTHDKYQQEKEHQKELIIQMMKDAEKDGLYDDEQIIKKE